MAKFLPNQLFEKFLLFRDYQCLNKDITVYIIRLLRSIPVIDTPFKFGRAYQLVKDKSKNIKTDRWYRKRRHASIMYMRSKTSDQIIDEAFEIISNYKNSRSFKSKSPNEWLDLVSNDGNDEDCFYKGRCVQFILDTNNKISIKDVFSYNNIYGEAHEMYNKILHRETKGKEYEVKIGSHYCTYTEGNRRCDCDDMRCYLDIDDAETLDDELLIRVDTW